MSAVGLNNGARPWVLPLMHVVDLYSGLGQVHISVCVCCCYSLGLLGATVSVQCAGIAVSLLLVQSLSFMDDVISSAVRQFCDPCCFWGIINACLLPVCFRGSCCIVFIVAS